MTGEVAAVDLWRVRLPLRRPLRSAHGTEDQRDLLLVRARLADGVEGWGECSALARPTYTGEHTSGAWLVLVEELVPALLAARPAGVVGHPMAAAALAGAVDDARARRAGVRLVDRLAALVDAAPAAAVARTAVIGRGTTIDDVVAAVAEALAGQPAAVKLKVTPSADDLDAVAAVRAAWPALELAVDFNGTADADALRRLAPLGLRYVEQPAPADDPVRSARLASLIDVPIALDESVSTAGELDAALVLGAGRILNVKPARCGGSRAAADLARRAREAGMDVFVGGMLESGVGRATALAVAALSTTTLPTDLGPSAAYFDRDLTEPITADERGALVVPEGPGIGRTPDLDRLAAVTVDHRSMAR